MLDICPSLWDHSYPTIFISCQITIVTHAFPFPKHTYFRPNHHFRMFSRCINQSNSGAIIARGKFTSV